MTHSYVWRDSFYVWHDSQKTATDSPTRCQEKDRCMRYDSFICVTRLILCVTWLTNNSDRLAYGTSSDRQIHVTWLVHMCDMTHSSVLWLISCEMWLIDHDSRTGCQKENRYVRHDSFICVTWLILCATWLVLCVTWLTNNTNRLADKMSKGKQICVTWLIHVCDMTHSMCDVIHRWHRQTRCTKKIELSDMTRPYASHNSSYVCHDSFYVCHDLFYVQHDS